VDPSQRNRRFTFPDGLGLVGPGLNCMAPVRFEYCLRMRLQY
jgi:hypothetical protein